MTARVLPPNEWIRLNGTLLETVWPSLNPAFVEIIVVEDDGIICGSVALMSVLHAECISASDGLGVRRALWAALGDRVRASGGHSVWAAAVDAPMTQILSRHAEPVPGEHFILSV